MLFTLISSAWAISAEVSPGDDLATVMSALGPGDVITFTSGTYQVDSTVRVAGAIGTVAEPIRLVGPADGPPALLKSVDGDTLLQIEDSTFVIVENLQFEGNDGYLEDGGGGVIIDDSTSVTFRNNEVRRTRWDMLRITGDTSDITIESNRFDETSAGTGIYVGCGDGSCWMSDSTIRNNLIRGTGDPENNRSGIVLDNGCQGNSVIDNVVYNITSDGIRVETTQLGPENTVEGNAVWDVGSDGIEVTGAALVRNNVVFETSGNGIRSYDQDGDFRNVRISYNTVALTGAEGVELNNWNGKEGMVFSSNVVANITGRGFNYTDNAEESTARITNNVVSGLVEGVDPTIQVGWFSPGSGVGDFEDFEAWNFYPTVSSTLVGAGDASGEAWVPGVDFNGNARNGEFPTVGALEFSGQGNPGWIIQEDFKGQGSRSGTNDPDGGGGGCCSKSNDTDEALMLLPFLAVVVGGRRRRRTL